MFHWRCFMAISLGLLLFLAESTNSQGSQVSLTLERGVSLVGEHCPGTVRLFCEGVDLPFLRWNYAIHNDECHSDNNIRELLPISESPSIISISNLDRAFLTIQVVSISPFRDVQNKTKANFSTILTADLVKLAQYDITRICCEQIPPQISDSVAVNISILEPAFLTPRILNITNFVATYQSGSLDSVEIQWMKLNLSCTVYKYLAVYELSIKESWSVLVNHTSCDEVMCTATVSQSELSRRHFPFTLKAYINDNSDNAAFEIEHSVVLESSSQNYFNSSLSFVDCGFALFSCESGRSFDKNTNCSLEYTASSTMHQLIIPINSTERFFYEVENSQLYHFIFSITVNKQLLINEQRMIEREQNTPLIKTEAIIAILISILFIVFSLMHITTVVLIKVFKIVSTMKVRPHFVAIIVLLSMDFVCILLFIILGSTFNEECSQTTQNSAVSYIMIVNACIGFTLLSLIWVFWGFQVIQHKKAHSNKSKTDRIQQNEKTSQRSQQSRLKSGSMSEKTIYDENFMVSVSQENYDGSIQFHDYDELEVVSDNTSEKMYMKLDKTATSDLVASEDKYTPLRKRDQKSHSAELTLSQSSCSHLNKRQPAVLKKSCLDKTNDLITSYDEIITERVAPDYDDVTEFITGQVDFAYDEVLASDKERVHSDYAELMVKALNVDYDCIIDSSSESECECRPDQKKFNASDGSERYNHLYESNKSQSAPNKDDPVYSHIRKTD